MSVLCLVCMVVIIMITVKVIWWVIDRGTKSSGNGDFL